MKLVYLSNARIPTEKAHGIQIVKTCEALVTEGADVDLVVPRRRNTLSDDPFSYYGLSRRFPIRRVWTWDLIRFGRIGFLIQAVTFGIASALFLRRFQGVVYSRDEIPLCIVRLFSNRTFVWESHDGAWNWCARYVAHRAKKIVVVSQGLKDWYVEHGVDASKIVVIPNAIDVTSFENPESKKEARTRLGLPQDQKIAMYIGRLDGWKGTDTLLEASKKLHDSMLVVIGGDSADIEKLKVLYPKVTFLGFRPYRELRDNQAAADVLVVPNTGKDLISVKFTSPLKLVAHLASERPIVASDLPSIREIVDESSAYLVRPDDPTALANGIEKALSNELEAHTRASRARARLSLYTWTARAEKILNLVA